MPVTPLGAPPPKLTSIFFNMDATVASSDSLAEDVMIGSGRTNTTTGKNIEGSDLIATYKGIISEKGLKYFKDHYFGGQERIDQLKQAFTKLRGLTGGMVQILTASWAPVRKGAWAEYVKSVSDTLGFGFDKEHVIGVTALGPPTIPDKAGALAAYVKATGTSPTGAVLVDATYKYANSVLEAGANYLLVDKSKGATEPDLEELIFKAGGKVKPKHSRPVRHLR
jgi:hypothetical protein